MAIARVYVNDVEVGSLPLQQYKNIVRSTWRDNRLYLWQVLNLAWVCWEATRLYLTVATVIACSLVFLGAVFFTNNVIETFDLFKAMQTSDQVLVVKRILLIYFQITSITIVLGVIWGIKTHQLGFKNYFGDKISDEIRHLLEVPTEGRFKIICVGSK